MPHHPALNSRHSCCARLAPTLLLAGHKTKSANLQHAPPAEKVARLLRNEPRIDRVRIDLDHDKTKGFTRFTAKGRIEICGPDLVASVNDADAYKAIDLLVDKLDAALRRRAGKKPGPRNDQKHQLPE